MTIQEESSENPEEPEKDGVKSKIKNETESIPDIQTAPEETDRQFASQNSVTQNSTSQNGANNQNGTPQNSELSQSKEEINSEDKKVEEQRPLSNYIKNITNSKSGADLSLDDKESKEATLFSDSKTVIRFSPVWKQVKILNQYA